MITPNAFHLIIKHFDEIDKRVSSKLLSARPWSEVSLTSILCDLLDANMQVDEKLGYSIAQLNDDLKKDSGLFGLSLTLNANQFSPAHERYVSQSDIGLQVVYENNIEPPLSWIKYFLLQAKRLMPSSSNPLKYNEKSTFSSTDKDQELRIQELKALIGNSLKHLLYCPRPEKLDIKISQKLNYHRLKILTTHIFDYIEGLEIHKDLILTEPTTAAGVFVADDITLVKNLEAVHSALFTDSTPFSWFIAKLFLDHKSHGLLPYETLDTGEQKLTKDIISGEDSVIEKLRNQFGSDKVKIPENFTIFPQHTLVLRFAVGQNPDRLQ